MKYIRFCSYKFYQYLSRDCREQMFQITFHATYHRKNFKIIPMKLGFVLGSKKSEAMENLWISLFIGSFCFLNFPSSTCGFCFTIKPELKQVSDCFLQFLRIKWIAVYHYSLVHLLQSTGLKDVIFIWLGTKIPTWLCVLIY